MKYITSVKENTSYIRYGNSGYSYYKISFINTDTQKEHKNRHVLRTFDTGKFKGDWYTHTGNGEADCSLLPELAEQCELFHANQKIKANA